MVVVEPSKPSADIATAAVPTVDKTASSVAAKPVEATIVSKAEPASSKPVENVVAKKPVEKVVEKVVEVAVTPQVLPTSTPAPAAVSSSAPVAEEAGIDKKAARAARFGLPVDDSLARKVRTCPTCFTSTCEQCNEYV